MTDQHYLPRYTWALAQTLGFATAKGFKALGLHPTTIRAWAARGYIHAVGKAPGGAHLYRITDVTRHAESPRSRHRPPHV